MRRLETKETIEQKQKRKTMIMSLFVLLLLILSTLGFAFLTNGGPANVQTTQPGQEITEQSNIIISYQGSPIFLSSTEDQIKDIPVDINVTPLDFQGKILYFKSNNQASLQEIGLTLGKIVGRVQEACLGPCEENLPEKDCTAEPILIINESETDRVYQEGSCIYIEGGVQAADAFVNSLFS